MPVVPIEELELLHRNVCMAVGEPKRIQILYALADRPQYVSELAETLETPQPTISRHLAVLRQSSLVSTERSGTTVTYSLANPRIIDILDNMRRLLREILYSQSDAVE